MDITKREDISFSKRLTTTELKKAIANALSNNMDKISEGELVKSFSIIVRNDRVKGTVITLNYKEEAYKPACLYGYNDCRLDPSYLVYITQIEEEESDDTFRTNCLNCKKGYRYNNGIASRRLW